MLTRSQRKAKQQLDEEDKVPIRRKIVKAKRSMPTAKKQSIFDEDEDEKEAEDSDEDKNEMEIEPVKEIVTTDQLYGSQDNIFQKLDSIEAQESDRLVIVSVP